MHSLDSNNALECEFAFFSISCQVFQNICLVILPQDFALHLNITVFREATASVAKKLLGKLKTECKINVDPAS